MLSVIYHRSGICLCLTAFALALSGCGDGSTKGGSGEADRKPANHAPGDNDSPVEASSPGGIEAHPLTDAGTEAFETLFTLLDPAATGVDVVNILDVDNTRDYLYNSGFACGGVSIGDVNGDGRPDLFFARGAQDNKLFLQREAMRFEDVSEIAGVSGDPGDWSSSATMADLDNDGDLDIYVCIYDGPNKLFLNPGDESKPFEEVAEQWGVDVIDASIMPSLADYDHDGDLDLFILTNRYADPNGRPRNTPVYTDDAGKPRVNEEYERFYGMRQVGPNNWTIEEVGRSNYLLRNDGETFTDVTQSAGLASNFGHGLSATWWDYDGDGLIDLHIGNDYTDADRLYRNNGDGTFTDMISEAAPFTSWSTMGADVGDLNGDGRLDFLSADMANTTHYKSKVSMGDMGDRRWALENAWPRQIMRNVVMMNTGTGHFSEAGFSSGLAKTDWSWAVKIADFDNDGLCDVFFTNGMARNFSNADRPISMEERIGQTEWSLWEDTPPLNETNLAFRNQGEMHFEHTEEQWGLDHFGMSYAAAYGDLDGDGDLDLVVNNLDEQAFIYRNNSSEGHRVVIELVGGESNRQGIGALVKLTTASGMQVRQLVPATGFLSTNDAKLHFGLGEDDVIETLEVYWPSGHTQTFEQLRAGQRFVITEPGGASEPSPTSPEAAPILAQSARERGLIFSHREVPYDDYAIQPLLPAKLTQLGGGMACGDVDGDGRDDVYLCGGGWQPGVLMLQTADGYQAKEGPWRTHYACEDMGALFFDADGDGDSDLLVASGSYEYARGSNEQMDRLYLNDGTGAFTHAPDALPQVGESSSAICAADFDGDGDLDLFIGARVVPGEYPVAPNSRLLQNDAGVFTDVTDTVAPGLRSAGLVTGAVWSDATGDGRPDLLLSVEWGPIMLFANTPDGFVDQTVASGMSQRQGWFNSVSACDIDGDGDTDYVALNLGLNSKYGHATPEKMAYLFYGNFDGEGMRLIEAKPGLDHTLLPVRGRSCSSNAIPQIADQYPTYHDFASASLEEIYTPDCLETALEMNVNCFESGVYVNLGDGIFEWRVLPREVQDSPGYGLACVDLDADGYVDLAMTQNLFTREPETGLLRGGMGLVLRGGPEGQFQAVSPSDSGLVVFGDGKGLAVLDADSDGRPDLIAGQNNDRLLLFTDAGHHTRQYLGVSLRGQDANPAAIGARITATYADGHTQAIELTSGGSYLSQSSGTAYLGNPESNLITSITVAWPDGSVTESIAIEAGQDQLVITQGAE